MSKLTLQDIDAYKKYSNGYTSSIATGIVKLTHGKTVIYLLPYGIGYECEQGIFINQLSESEFNKLFSLIKEGY